MTRLLHVTDVLPRPAYSCDPWYLERGRAVHLACHYLDTVGLDWDRLDPRLEGYVRAWDLCKRETGVTIIGSEVSVIGPGPLYKGTTDKVVEYRRRDGVWDLKCGPHEPWQGLQTAAYAHGLRPKISAHALRFSVHLSGDGTYTLVEHKGKEDLRDFLAYLRVAYWEINHGLREWPALREGETE